MKNARTIRTGFARSAHALLLSGGVLLGLGHAASAQFAFEDDILPPRVVAWRLADRGFSGIGRPRFDGRVYVVDAVGPAGAPVRLFVDPADGAIVGRQRLGAPETYARLERPAPGFGWTEEDATPRRVLRAPAGDLPAPPALRPVRRPAGEAARPETNPLGLNPDGTARPEAPRKLARVAPPARQPALKPALKASPEAPAPKIAPAEVAPADTAKVDPKPQAPAAAGKPAPEGARAEAAKPPAADKPANGDWKDPPADKRPVRVIGGATIVPGTVEKEPGAQ